MIKNENYNSKITIKKGGKQLVCIVSSSGIALLIVIVLKLFTDKEFNVADIQQIIEDIDKKIIVIVPLVSSIIAMINNFRKNYYK